MREYRQYKGMYIGPGCFNSKEEIDRFLEKKAVEYFKITVELFLHTKNMDYAIFSDKKKKKLVNQYGYTWEQIEAIEAEIYEKMAEIA